MGGAGASLVPALRLRVVTPRARHAVRRRGARNLILHLAVGNRQMGPDANMPFPAKLQVDWVRVYQ